MDWFTRSTATVRAVIRLVRKNVIQTDDKENSIVKYSRISGRFPYCAVLKIAELR